MFCYFCMHSFIVFQQADLFVLGSKNAKERKARNEHPTKRENPTKPRRDPHVSSWGPSVAQRRGGSDRAAMGQCRGGSKMYKSRYKSASWRPPGGPAVLGPPAPGRRASVGPGGGLLLATALVGLTLLLQVSSTHCQSIHSGRFERCINKYINPLMPNRYNSVPLYN